MVAKKTEKQVDPTENSEEETPEVFDPETFVMPDFDKDYVYVDTAYSTYKLKRPKGPKVGRDHLRLMRKYASKLSFNETMIVSRLEILKILKESGLEDDKAIELLNNCGLKEPADQQQIDNEEERQEKAETEWLDTVLPAILPIELNPDSIPAEDFSVIFQAMHREVKFRPDYFHIIRNKR
jgi:hypothetical protein